MLQINSFSFFQCLVLEQLPSIKCWKRDFKGGRSVVHPIVISPLSGWLGFVPLLRFILFYLGITKCDSYILPIRTQSEIFCIFQKAKQHLERAQVLHSLRPSFHKVKVPTPYCRLKGKKSDLWQLSQTCIIFTLLQGLEWLETFSKWDAEVHSPQTVTWAHSSLSSHLSNDVYNPWLHLYSLTKPEQAYRGRLGMRAAFKQRG